MFFDQNLEGFGHGTLRNRQTLDDGFEGFGTANDVVGLDGEHFLKSVGRFVSFEGPDLHFSEALTTHLSFAAEGLLGNEGIWAGRAGMGFVLDHVNKLEDIGDSNGGLLGERLAGAAIIKLNFGTGGIAGLFQKGADTVFVYLFKDGNGNFEPKAFGGKTQLGFQELTEIHTSKNRKGRDHNIDRTTVSGIGHIGLRDDLADDTFVAVATGQLITDSNPSELGDLDPDLADDTGLELVTLLPIQDLDGDDSSLFAVGHAQRGVSDLTGFFTKDSAEKSFFGSQFGLAFGGNFAHQNIVRADRTADDDNAVRTEVFEIRLAHVGDVGGQFFGTKFGVHKVGHIFIDVNRTEEIFLEKTGTDDNGVFVTQTLERPIGNKQILTDGQFAVVGRGTIDDDVALFDHFSRHNDRELAIAGTLRGAMILSNVIGFNCTLNGDETVIGVGDFFDRIFGVLSVEFDADMIGVGTNYFTGVSGANNPAHGLGHCRLHTGTDNGGFGFQKGNGLGLHVTAHEGTGTIIMLNEGDQRGGSTDNLTGDDVDQLDLGNVDLDELTVIAGGNPFVSNIVAVSTNLGMGNVISFFVVGGNINNFIGNAHGSFATFLFLNNLEVRRFKETKFIDSGIKS